jgi:altronate hydrolase
MSSIKNAIHIHPHDSVAVALEPLKKGQIVLGTELASDIPSGHKFALENIQEGSPVIKYGYPIGKAVKSITRGEHIHTHNVKTLLSEAASYTYKRLGPLQNKKARTLPEIQAYRRKNGSIGIRNEIWIIPTVGCVNKTAEALAQKARAELCIDNCGIDGVFAWTHPYGCSQMGSDHETTRQILADLALHPNAGAVLVIGLGCENNTVKSFKELIAEKENDGSDETQGGRIEYLITQDSADEIQDGLAALKKLISFASQFKRESVSASELVIGMKCGGSDGLSGITANPLAGRICDYTTSGGGSVILTEVPEMFGAEQLLMNRCVSQEVFNKTVSLINGFKDYFVKHNQVVYENPSPGNKDGGITTLEDKSLGCVQKGGTADVCGVMAYGERIRDTLSSCELRHSETSDAAQTGCSGLYLLEGPGNDIVSTTAMTAAGAHIILFTTGRGTPLGAPVPTIKISTNEALAKKKPSWIDFDASLILSKDPEEVQKKLFELIVKTADGEYKTCNEKNEYREIAILKDGVTL